MKTMELIRYSRRKIKGKRREIFLICTPPIVAELFFRLAEASVYSIMLYLGAFKPLGLFTGESIEQILITVVFVTARYIISAPLYCASAVRLIEFAEDSDKKTSFSDILLEWRFIWRSLFSFFMRKMICTATLIPAIISGLYGIKIISENADDRQLFLASNLFALCIVFIIFWLGVKISMTAVPFLLAEFPKKSVLKVVFDSFRFMNGRKKMFIGISFVFLLPVATIVAIPFVIPEIASAYAVGISIFFKEDEYAHIVHKSKRKRIFARKIRQSGEI